MIYLSQSFTDRQVKTMYAMAATKDGVCHGDTELTKIIVFYIVLVLIAKIKTQNYLSMNYRIFIYLVLISRSLL